MKNKRFAFLTIITVTLSLIFFVAHQSYKKDEGRKSSEIYSQVLAYRPLFEAKNFLTDCLSHKRKLLISSESNIFLTSQGKSWQEVSTFDLQQIQNSTWRDFSQTNSIVSNFPSDLSLGCEYTLVDLKNYESVQSSDCPIIMLSKIGLNKTKNQALVLLSQSCGQNIWLTLFLLDLVNGHWHVTDAVSPPVSFTY